MNQEPLSLWNKGEAKERILRFVLSTTLDGSEQYVAHVGTLDRGLDEAALRDWIVVSMRKDWYRIFA